MADIVAENFNEKTIKGNEEFEASSPELHKHQSENTNSHHHDSEYDTANYDTSDDEHGDDSLDQEDGEEQNKSSTGSEFDEEEEETQRGDAQEQVDYMKKVDEDRSNPQYIPKKGTFYEHDDRTTEDPDVIETQVSETSEGLESSSKTVTPTISSASKTMKKWQAASGIDRWSHDRFEESEQAPKSRAELVSAYGYDIRNEDGPPRARRRRRYGRGPTKYSRNWEDESAYIKANNIQRKSLRPEDFPVLGDKKNVQKNTRNFKEEKENHYENRRSEGGIRRPDGRSGSGSNDDNRGSNNSNRNYRSGGNRRNNDFKNKNRSNNYDNQKRGQQNSVRQLDNTRDIGNNYDDLKSQVETLSFTNTKVSGNSSSGGDNNIMQHQLQQRQQHERYNNGYDNFHSNQSSNNRELGNTIPNLLNSQQQQQKSDNQMNAQLQNSKLSNRLQQRNDPSHVGSVQMHTLASPQQNLLSNLSDLHHPSAVQQQQQEQAKPKRYSSLRQRTPNDNPVIQQNNQIEQLNFMPHEPTAQQQVLLYHQEQVVAAAQMQGVPIQSLPKPPPPQFSNQVQSQYPPAGTAFYTAGPPPPPNEYVTGPPPPGAPIMQLAATAYLQQQSSAAGVQSQPPPPPPQTSKSQPPPPINYVQNPPPNAPPQNQVPTAPYQNYPPPPGPAPAQQFPNYNTVGGTTYFVPHVQPAPRSNALPQRRPTNAIPILAPPSDKSKQHSSIGGGDKDQFGSVENIDHILDNMFVQRAPYVPPPQNAIIVMPPVGATNNNDPIPGTIVQQTTTENRLNEAIMSLHITDTEKNNSSENQEDTTSSSSSSIEKKCQPADNLIKNSPEINTSVQQIENDN